MTIDNEFMTRNISTFKIAQPVSQWLDGAANDITFIVTEDCQLKCQYCYFVSKNSNNKLSFEIAKRTIDYLLTKEHIYNEKSVILDFIGGEPFLEIDLIDKICDYFKIQSYKIQHHWFDNYRINFSTNGLLYGSPKVQQFINKNRSHVNVGFSIDGTKNKHDVNRVYPNGSGSYDDVVKNIPLWLSQFPDGATKVTVARDDLLYINESVLHLWSLGILNVNINVVFEDVWEENDDVLFEDQLKILADEIISKDLYDKYFCSFFSKDIGKRVESNQNWCGAGRMLAIDHTGNFYPCIRFTQFSLENKPAIIIGNCFDGVNLNKLRPFLTLDLMSQSIQECIDCEVGTGCAWCQGANYDNAETDTIYQRATYICKMHKARVRANEYFWKKLEEKINKKLK